ncbi:MAG: hypothetical protein K1X94_18250 [Sandaracinaceae bacterium]|nr:hypothetical protein [Sandaracinaceae bacterium]
MERSWRMALLAPWIAVVGCDGTSMDPDAAAGVDTTIEEADAAGAGDAGTGVTDAGPSDAGSAGGAYAAPMTLGELTGVPETSGIVASRDHPGVFWIHNDSGNPAEIFAIDTSPRVLATISLAGATNEDWEDITLVPREGPDLIYVGDHGDNLARETMGASSYRDGTVRLYRLEEPDPSADASVSVEAIALTYPDGPHDCEALFADPESGDVYLVTKVDAGSAEIYVARAPLVAPGPLALTHVASLDMLSVTAADLSGDRTRLVLRNYSQIRVYAMDLTDVPGSLTGTPTRPSARGSFAEAIAFGAGGYDLYTLAEGDPSTLLHIPWE